MAFAQSLLALPDEQIEPEQLPILGPRVKKLMEDQETNRDEALLLGIMARKMYNKLSEQLNKSVRHALLLTVVRMEHLLGSNIPVDPQ